jgi:hypothetical protein
MGFNVNAQKIFVADNNPAQTAHEQATPYSTQIKGFWHVGF